MRGPSGPMSCTCMRMHARVHAYVCVRARTCVFVYVHMCACVYVYVCMRVRVYMHVGVCVYVCMHVCVRACTCEGNEGALLLGPSSPRGPKINKLITMRASRGSCNLDIELLPTHREGVQKVRVARYTLCSSKLLADSPIFGAHLAWLFLRQPDA